MFVVIQTAARPDGMTDGVMQYQTPYPLIADQGTGIVLPGSGLSPLVRSVVGFVTDLKRQEVDTWWADVDDWPALVGSYPVVRMRDGHWSTLDTAVESVEVIPVIT